MLILNFSFSLLVMLFKLTLMFMLLNVTMLIASSSQIDHKQNLTQLLSDFVLTCGSSEGFCNKSQSPFQVEPAALPKCAAWLACSPSCALDNTCAPDAEYAYIDVSCISNTIYPLNVVNSTYSYNMITQCGIFSLNNADLKTDTDALCINVPERNMDNLHDDVFRSVIARNSLITCRNAHCARCNHEDDIDLVSFGLQVECHGHFDINSLKYP